MLFIAVIGNSTEQSECVFAVDALVMERWF